MRTNAVGLLVVAAALVGACPDAVWAQQRPAFYVTIDGTKQGRLKGESAVPAHAGQVPGLRFTYTVTSPREATVGLALPARQQPTMVFTKEWGAASPQLFSAAVTGEVLKSVVFEFVKSSGVGQEYVFQTIRLTNATVTSIRMVVGPLGAEGPDRPYEEVSLAFQSITIENLDGKTVAMDSRSVR
jgi:type VI secretion system secreted protein Hcp